ncbi:Neutral amino acid transporter A [Echinococcus granulosus]|uniref:Amino acid transporter n=1 Tax=Echinococcus granulosus TaxID=6210 RepID=W6UJH7_ECHGR|nr:Neutral amino acid transporter A [Echinococcus granulosus]EUB61670.1 Neutral amino acid transporter A [Echinococcus granulosus]
MRTESGSISSSPPPFTSGPISKLEVEGEKSVKDGNVGLRDRNACVKFLANNWFMLATIGGVCLGFGLGFIVRTTQPGTTAITWIAMPSDIYLRLLQLTILPLISSNILIAFATLDFKKDGKVGIIGILYIFALNLVCAVIGAVCALLIQPGSRVLVGNTNESAPLSTASGLTASDVFRDLFYSIIFGAAAKVSGEVAKTFIDFFKALSAIVTKIMSVFLLVTPVAVCFMIASSVVGRKNIESDFVQLGLFVVTVLTALAIHFILIILVFFISSRKNPLRLLKYSGPAYILAFATTSPALALPETYMGLDKYGVRQSVSRLLCPLAATLKGDGPAAFIAASVIFVAQNSRIELNIGQIFTILILTFTSSLATPNIPSASIVLIVTILSSIGVPTEGAGLLFAMEWLMDRCRSGSGALSILFLTATAEAIYDKIKKRKNAEETEFFTEHDEDSTSPV